MFAVMDIHLACGVQGGCTSAYLCSGAQGSPGSEALPSGSRPSRVAAALGMSFPGWRVGPLWVVVVETCSAESMAQGTWPSPKSLEGAGKVGAAVRRRHWVIILGLDPMGRGTRLDLGALMPRPHSSAVSELALLTVRERLQPLRQLPLPRP